MALPATASLLNALAVAVAAPAAAAAAAAAAAVGPNDDAKTHALAQTPRREGDTDTRGAVAAESVPAAAGAAAADFGADALLFGTGAAALDRATYEHAASVGRPRAEPGVRR